MYFYKKCISKKIKPIIGLHVILKDFSLCLYAKNYEGYKSLIKLSTIQNERVVTFSDLEKYNNSFSFYTPICKWGYPYAITNDKLIKCIQNFDMELYLKNLHICQKSMGICETGYAREAVYHEIMNHRKDK